MVQIIPRIPSTSERFGQAFVNTGKNLAGIGGEYLIQKKEKNLRDENFSKENEFFKKRFGIDISNVKNPELRQKYFDMALQAENQKNLQSQKAKDELGLASQQSQNAFNSASQLQSQKHGLGLEELAQKHQYNLGESSQQSQNAFNNASQLQSQKHDLGLEELAQSHKYNLAQNSQQSQNDLNKLSVLENQKQSLKTNQSNLKEEKERNEKTAPFKNALNTIKRMRELGKKGNLGKTLTRGVFGGEESKDRAEYERLGKSLISLSSTIPIRNKAEFETLAGDLYDPSIRDSARAGILDAMEQIIMGNLKTYSPEGQNSQNIDQQRQPIVMKDREGNTYDIPFELYEQAKSQGLIE